MNVLYILGKGTADQNKELKFSLRMLEKHGKNIDDVFLFGENPRFHSDQLKFHYMRDYNGNKEYRIAKKILEACKKGVFKGDFLFINDDHFFIDDFNAENYPNYAKGELQHKTPNRSYQQSLINTRKYLESLNKTTFHFDIHTPIIYNTEKFIAMEPHIEVSKKQSSGFVVKSLYGNLYGLTPTMATDLKLNRFNEEKINQKLEGRHVFSCSDSGWRTGLKNWLNKNYPNKSKYEK